MTKTMMAIGIEKQGEETRLVPFATPRPQAGPGQVLIKVHAAGVNRADLLQAAGRYPPPRGAPDIMGLEVSGVIETVGPEVRDLKIGDRVCALLRGGGYAEYAAASALCVLPVPEGVSLRDAAGLPETHFTVWSNLLESGRLQPGETVLVHGGSSGIGTAAIQFLHARGHTVFTTAGSAEKCAACEHLGAARAIQYRKEDFANVVIHETAGRGVDVVLDMVGGDYVQRNLNVLAHGGRLVNIAFQKSVKAEVDFRVMQTRHLTMTATGMRSRSDEEKGHIRDALLRDIWPLFAAGRMRLVVAETFPLEEAEAAHAVLRESRHIGKILLEIGSGLGV